MYKKCLLLLLTLTAALHTFSQTGINGKVYDQNNNLLNGFNAVLLNPNDSSIVKGGFFMDGNFELQQETGNYILQIGALSFRDTLLTVEIGNAPTTLAPITLISKNINLDEIQVKAKPVVYRQQADKLIMNVEHSPLSESGNVVDILKKSVKIKVDGEDEISVLGKGKAQIYLNGRKVASNQMLSLISSEEIKSIEIIENPSVEYAADANAVINIVTRSKSKYGSGAKFISTTTKRTNLNQATQVQFSKQTARNTFYTSYSISNRRRTYEENFIRNYSQKQIINDVDERLHLKQTHYLRLNNNFQFNKNATLDVVLNSGFYKGDYSTQNKNSIYAIGFTTPESQLNSEINSPLKRTLLNGLASYNFTSDDQQTTWKVSAEHYYYDATKHDFIEEGNSKTNRVANTFRLTAFDSQANFRLSKKTILKTGAQFSFNKNGSNNTFGTENSLQTEVFKSKEQSISGFGKLRHKAGKWNISGGLRVEYLQRNSATNQQTIVDEHSIELLPTLAVNREITNNLAVNLSYNRRLKRPSFQDLNPAINYIDSLSYMQGNPNLNRSKIHALNLKLTYMKYASLSLYYNNIKNGIFWFIDSSEASPLVSIGMQKNLPKIDVLGADLLLPYQNKMLTIYVASGLKQTQINSLTKDLRHTFSWYLSSGLDLNLPLGITTNVNCTYFSDGINGIWTYDSAWKLNAELQRNFLNKRLNLSLSFEDIFKSNIIKSETTIGQHHIRYDYYRDDCFVRLRLSYKLNNLKSAPKVSSILNSDAGRIKSNVK